MRRRENYAIYIFVYFLLLLLTTAARADMTEISTIQAHLDRHAAPNSEQLAQAIYVESKDAGVSSELVTRIIIVESRGVESAVNTDSLDYGLMQINTRTAKAYKIKMTCLMQWRCNLKAGIRILADMKKHRPCAYNVGPARSKKETTSCLKYERKLASVD